MRKSATRSTPPRYPQPGPVGGRLIRHLVAQMKNLPQPHIGSHILIGVSGGSDSTALALLLAKYGRQVISPTRLRILHVNHGWRGASSDADARWVRRRAKEWGIACTVVKALAARPLQGESPENRARNARKLIYLRYAARYNACLLTAHTQDDLAETILWRLMTGTFATQSEGIRFREGVEIRPLLGIRKTDLQAFLEEEGLEWREDSTNFDGQLLRSKMRLELFPRLESIFPRAVQRLAALAEVRPPNDAAISQKLGTTVGQLLSLTGTRIKSAHYQTLKNWRREPAANRVMLLPKGWTLRSEKASLTFSERWVLEKNLSTRKLKENGPKGGRS